MPQSLTNHEIIIIGGGAVGCGVAYQLAKAGKTDILVVEREENVGQVTTSQGAGLCGQVRSTADRTRLAMHSTEVFRELQANGDVKPQWNAVGSLRIAYSDAAVKLFHELKSIADECDLETELIDNEAAGTYWPQMDFTDVKAVLWCPTDGYMIPVDVAAAYRSACENMGVTFAPSTTVTDIVRKNSHVEGIRTNNGDAECKIIINAAGAHAYHVARMVGLELPIVPVRHEYFVTVPMDGLTGRQPTFRVPDMGLYGRVAEDGLLLGGWEGKALHTDPRQYDNKEEAPKITPDDEVLDSFETRFTRLLPTAKAQKRARIAKGWPTFTPDGNFIIGESSQVRGFVMAGGCNAHGISGSGGIGKLLVESMMDDNPSDYVKSLSPDRFTESSWSWDTAAAQAKQVYETYYEVESC